MVKQLANLDLGNSARIVNHPAAQNANDLILKSDLDSAIAELSGVGLQAPQDLNCSTNPNYPASSKGQTYYVTAAGRVGGASGVLVNIGDLIICKAESGSAGGTHATVGGDFFIVESNRDRATETELGVISLATQTEVNNGTITDKSVTPLTLQTKLNNSFNSRRYSSAIGDSTNTTFSITHSLNDPNVQVQIRETNSPFEVVIADISWIDANNIQVKFNNPPSTNAFTVSIR